MSRMIAATEGGRVVRREECIHGQLPAVHQRGAVIRVFMSSESKVEHDVFLCLVQNKLHVVLDEMSGASPDPRAARRRHSSPGPPPGWRWSSG